MTYATDPCSPAGRPALHAPYTTLLLLLLLAAPLVAPAVAQTTLLPSSTTSNDRFGQSVDIDGNYAIVGTSTDVVYIFFWDGDRWIRQVTLTAPGTATSTQFGYSVAISGDRALVAAPGQAGDTRYGNGEVYVYTRTGSSWMQEDKITASDGDPGDFFGGAVALDGDRALIGALRDSENGYNTGAAYLFTYNGTSWSEKRLTPSVINEYDYFGSSVSIGGDYAIVGAPGYDVNDMSSVGAAYIFEASLGWGQRTRLTNNVRPSSFGHAVAIDDYHGFALVGAPGYNGHTGAAYFYELSDASWTHTDVEYGDATGDRFGLTVALHNSYALVNTDLFYPWTSEPAQWTRQATVSVSQSTDGDEFGEAIAFDGTNILIGAPGTGTLNYGAAYVVEIEPQFTSSTSSVTLPDAPAGGTTNETVTITNTGLESLTIIEIINANPVFSASPSSFTLAPEASETVTITFTPSEVGLYEDELTFTHTGSGNSTTITVRGTVRDAEPSFNPDPLVFATTPPGSTTPRTLTVGNSGGVALEVTNVTSTNDAFSVATPTFNVPVDGGYALEVSFTPTAVGAYEGDLIFEHNGADSPDTLTVSGQGRGAETSFSPNPLAFSTLALDSTETRTVTVSSTGLEDLEVESITSTTGAFSAATTAFSVAIGNTYELEVTFAPTVAGTYEDSLVFVHNGADSPDTLAVSGTARGAEISFSPNALAFPTTALDSTAAHTLTVSSTGLVDLEVTNITTLGSAFSVAETAFDVPVGEGYELEVLFTPTVDSTYADSLIITHNGITSPDTVAVSGTGRGAEIVLEQEELKFASAKIYESTFQTLTVQNVGISPLVVSKIEVIDPEHGTPLFTFSTDVDTFRVPPKEDEECLECSGTYNLIVTFTPDAPGPHAAMLRLTHNADTEPTLVPLTGEGLLPGVKLTTFRETAETSAPSFVTVAFQATDEYGRGLDFLDDTDLYDIQDGNLDVDEDEESIPSVEDFGAVPFTLRTVLMLDNSSSIGGDLDDLKAAARAFVDQLLPQQEVALFVFSEEIVMLEDFTSNVDSLREAIDGIRLGPNSTNLYGAVIEGVNAYEEYFEITGQDARFEVGTMVLFSDGQDTQGTTTKEAALMAISGRQVVTVSVGETAQSALPELHTAPFVQPIQVANFGQLKDAFEQVQRELVRFSNSFYWLTYASPRRGDFERTLTVSLKENSYAGPGASFTVTYNSNGFSALNPGVYINRSIKALGGVTTLEVVGGRDTLVTAEVLLVRNPPHLEWTPADPSLLTVTPVTSDGTEVMLRYHGEANTSTTVTVTDISNLDYLGATRTITVTAPTVTSTEVPVPPPTSFLQPNYPNPFHGTTTFRYGLDRPQHVRLAIYDLTGRQVAVLVDATQAAGRYEVPWNAHAMPSGVYFVRAVGESFVATQQVVLVR